VLTGALGVLALGTFVVLFGSSSAGAETNDFNRDGSEDVAVYRPSDGVWYILQSGGGVVSRQWGIAGDVPVPGDYDDDGRRDIAVYRPSSGDWYIVPSSSGAAFSLQWGAQGDRPVSGDYDGDRRADLAVWRPSEGVWYVLTSSSAYRSSFAVQWGSSALGDIPVPGDFDGDGATDIAVWRPDSGVWFVKTSSSGYAEHLAVQWGAGALGDIPLVGDFDGDTRADIAVWRPGAGMWYVKRSSTSYATSYAVQWGAPGDSPVVGDYDGDGKSDPTVFRPSEGTWYQLRSRRRNVFTVAWGQGGDLPIDNPRKTAVTAGATPRRAAAAPRTAAPRPPAAPAPITPSTVGGSGSGRLRVMTWNIHFGKTPGGVLNLDAQARVMANSSADVILLQEASTWDGDQPNSFPAKLKALTGRTWYKVWSSHNRTGSGEGTLILTRLPVVSSSIANYNNRGFSRVAVSVNGVTIDIFNGHLDVNTSLRTSELRSWMAWMDTFSGPEIAGGDFNAWWGESWIKTMETKYSDTWQDYTGSDQNGHTIGNVRFDYLFRSRDSNGRLTPTAASVVSTSTSDHRPVIADYVVR
jgi:endonuclease/exonuclease/phosphatase family metal-dependent hydrolase